MIVSRFQKCNKMTLSVNSSASQQCPSHLGLLHWEFWCKLAGKRAANTHNLLTARHTTSQHPLLGSLQNTEHPTEHPPLRHQPSAPLLPAYGASETCITELMWIKNNPASEAGCVFWHYEPTSLSFRTAQSHRYLHWHKGSAQKGCRPIMGGTGLGTLQAGIVI